MTTMDKSSRDSKEESGPPTTSDSKKWIDTGMKPLPKDLGTKIQAQYQPWFPRELFFPTRFESGESLGVQRTLWTSPMRSRKCAARNDAATKSCCAGNDRGTTGEKSRLDASGWRKQLLIEWFSNRCCWLLSISLCLPFSLSLHMLLNVKLWIIMVVWCCLMLFDVVWLFTVHDNLSSSGSGFTTRLTSCRRQIVGQQKPFTSKTFSTNNLFTQDTFDIRSRKNPRKPFAPETGVIHKTTFIPERFYTANPKAIWQGGKAKPCDPSHHAFLTISRHLAVWLRTYELRWWPWSLKGKMVSGDVNGLVVETWASILYRWMPWLR